MLTLLLFVAGAIALSYITIASVRELRTSTSVSSLLEKVNFCVGNGFIAATLIFTMLKIAGMSVGWFHVFLVMPIPLLIYGSVLVALKSSRHSDNSFLN